MSSKSGLSDAGKRNLTIILGVLLGLIIVIPILAIALPYFLTKIRERRQRLT